MRALLVVCGLATVALAQPGPHTASIEGAVVDQATGAPLADATVRLKEVSRNGSNPEQVEEWASIQTNEVGRFVFSDLGDATWELSADRRGYLNAVYGARLFDVHAARVSTKGKPIKDLVIRMVPQAVITGRVLDTDGEPVEGARVSVLKSGTEVGFSTTLDNGTYRIARVPAGKYIVQCQVPRVNREPSTSGAETAYATASLPDVTVTSGAEIGGVDIRVARTPVYYVRGHVEPASASNRGTYAVLVDRSDPTRIFAESGYLKEPNYAMDFERIPPGSYIVFAWWYVNSTPLVATQVVEVKQSGVDNLVLTPLPAEILGSALLVTQDRPVDLRGVAVEIRQRFVLQRDGPAYYAGSDRPLGKDRTFRIPVVTVSLPKLVSFTVSLSKLPENCYVASIQYGGREITDTSEYLSGAALDIAIASDGGAVKGQTVDKDGKASPSAVVALAPASGKGRPRSLVSDASGTFQLTAVPPGDYKLLAFDDVSRDDLENPEFLARFEGQPVKIAPGESANAAVPVVAPR